MQGACKVMHLGSIQVQSIHNAGIFLEIGTNDGSLLLSPKPETLQIDGCNCVSHDAGVFMEIGIGTNDGNALRVVGPKTQFAGSPGSKQTHSQPAEKLCSHFLLDPKTL
jgi:hypothetical protein